MPEVFWMPIRHCFLLLNQGYTRAWWTSFTWKQLPIVDNYILYNVFIVNEFNVDTLNLHRGIFFMKNLDIANFQRLHWFGECNFQTLAMPDVIMSKVTFYILRLKHHTKESSKWLFLLYFITNLWPDILFHWTEINYRQQNVLIKFTKTDFLIYGKYL